jgi:hypothetical protein
MAGAVDIVTGSYNLSIVEFQARYAAVFSQYFDDSRVLTNRAAHLFGMP